MVESPFITEYLTRAIKIIKVGLTQVPVSARLRSTFGTDSVLFGSVIYLAFNINVHHLRNVTHVHIDIYWQHHIKHVIYIGSMYAIYGNIYHQYTPNVSIYTIHGSYGIYIDTTLYYLLWWLILKCCAISRLGRRTMIVRKACFTMSSTDKPWLVDLISVTGDSRNVG